MGRSGHRVIARDRGSVRSGSRGIQRVAAAVLSSASRPRALFAPCPEAPACCYSPYEGPMGIPKKRRGKHGGLSIPEGTGLWAQPEN